MLSGSRRSRGGDEYVFIDGKAMTADEAVRIQLTVADTATVPGQAEATAVPGAAEAGAAAPKPRKSRARDTLRKMESDGLDLREEMVSNGISFAVGDRLMADDRRKSRRRNLIAGAVLLVLVLFGCCISAGYTGLIYNPADVIGSLASWFKVAFAQITAPATAADVRYEVMSAYPMYGDVIASFLDVVKYCICGMLLALSGMLYQNAFRNPIAAPSMLGASSGINLALLILVMVFGTAASTMLNYYYLFSFLGGLIILLLVFAGGKWISGKGRFNVVNMILMGTVVSQLVGVIITYVQNYYLTEMEWQTYYTLQAGAATDSSLTYITLFAGAIIGIVPVVLFRFRLNLVSFDDQEARLLGVDPEKLRLLALFCGTVMILAAQVNAGQVAMASLVVPFVVRAVFGAEFRRQIMGNILFGAIILLIGGEFVSFFQFSQIMLSIGDVVTICAMPLFVWMIAMQQRSWE